MTLSTVARINARNGLKFVLLLSLGALGLASPSAYAQAPVISSISVNSGYAGQSSPITINGSNFGTPGTVTFNGVAATQISYWGSNTIVPFIPVGATSGPLVVTTSAGSSGNSTTFTIISTPTLTSVNPSSAQAGTPLVISGTTLSGCSTVQIAGQQMTVSPTSSTIAVSVPLSIATGAASVVVLCNGLPTNTLPLTILPPPALSGIAPVAGLGGTPVTLAGSGVSSCTTLSLGGTQVASTATATSIQATLPSGTPLGAMSITALCNGYQTNSVSFTVAPIPAITGFPVPSAFVGQTVPVEIDGVNFGTAQGSVTFNGTAVTSFTSWSPTKILAVVPSGATSGAVVVTAGGVASGGTAFSIVPAPVLTGISPVAGLAGTALTLSGSGLSSCTTVSMGGAQVAGTPTATSVSATLPSAAPLGSISASAICNGYTTNSVPFMDAPVPLITSVSPSSAYAGQTVPIEINGINFGTGTPTVTFNGAPVATFSYAGPTVIVPFVPAGASSGSIVVTAGGVASPGFPYTINQQPSITNISPPSGTPGTPITISGTNLSGCSVLSFGTVGYGVAPAATSLSTAVQTGAIAASGGSVHVQFVCAEFLTNIVNFTVLPASPPAITSVTPSALYDAQTYPSSGLAKVTLKGTNFGTSGTVNFTGGSALAYNSSDGQTIVVPAYLATTGPITVTTSGATSSGFPFTVAPAPTILTATPRSGQVGSTVQVAGANLTAVAGTNLASCGTLLFNSTAVAISPSSPTNVSVAVPAAATSGPGEVSLVCNGYQTGNVPFTVGTAYDNGSVGLTVNGVTDYVPYGKSQNTTAAALAASMISTVNADPNAFVTAAASGASGITLTSREPGASANYVFSLLDNYDTYDFGSQSFAFSPASGSLGGGADAAVTQTPVYSYKITGYDPDGNLLSYTDTVNGSWSFGYDPLNRLLSASVSSGSYGGTNITGATLGWTYDQYGNRLTQSSSSGAVPTGSTQFSGANNQATGTGLATSPNQSTNTLQYDAAGNLNARNGIVQSIYDAEDRLCATTIGSGGFEGYIYDAGGNRVAKGTITTLSCDATANGFVLTNQYLLGPGGEQMTELTGAGVWVHTNMTANGSLIATFDNDNKGVHFHLTDWLGTRRVQTTYLGSVENSWTTLPYGEEPSPTSPDATEQHFTGKMRDTESGLDYFGARYYASNMGRFMSPDWAAKAEPVPYAKLDNPQSLNLYGYVLNNPLSHLDADGHEGCAGSYGSECARIAFGLGPMGYNTSGPKQKKNSSAQQHSAAIPLTSDTGNVVRGANGHVALVPVNFDIGAVLVSGVADRAVSLLNPVLGAAATAADLTRFIRGNSWDIQRLDGPFDARYRDSATILIGMFAASAGLSRDEILGAQNSYAKRSDHPNETAWDSKYENLPARNVRDTDIGMGLITSGAIVPQ